MNNENRELMEAVVKQRLEAALDSSVTPEESKRLFDEAMKAVDRQIESDKLDISYSEHVEKLELEKEKDSRDEAFKKEEAKKNRWIRAIEIGTAVILVPAITFGFNMAYAKRICNFEKTETFYTTPGRGLSKLFNLRNK